MRTAATLPRTKGAHKAAGDEVVAGDGNLHHELHAQVLAVPHTLHDGGRDGNGWHTSSHRRGELAAVVFHRVVVAEG